MYDSWHLLLKDIVDIWSVSGVEIRPHQIGRRLIRQTYLCNRQMSKAKSAHYSKIIAEHSGDDRLFWKAFNKILLCCPKLHLPDYSSIVALANIFSSFFINIISIIHSSFPSGSWSVVLNHTGTGKVLQKLTSVTDAGVWSWSVAGPG